MQISVCNNTVQSLSEKQVLLILPSYIQCGYRKLLPISSWSKMKLRPSLARLVQEWMVPMHDSAQF